MKEIFNYYILFIHKETRNERDCKDEKVVLGNERTQDESKDKDAREHGRWLSAKINM